MERREIRRIGVDVEGVDHLEPFLTGDLDLPTREFEGLRRLLTRLPDEERDRQDALIPALSTT